jgi:Predicted esterase of the alpha-beta hydrolase superfamily
MKNKKESPKYKLGVALSGGGARGFAHLGALQAMTELGLKPDIITGTSAGSLVGVFFADGYSPAEVMELFSKVKFGEFASTTIPQDGFFKTTGLQSFLKKHLRAKTFEELQMPLRVVASDIEKGETVIISSGDIASAVVASCTFPIVFTPVKIGGKHLVDGGLFMNLPVSIIREECEKIIGVNVSYTTTMPYSRSLKYIIERSLHHLMASNALADREECDYLIESEDITKFPLFELDNAQQIYQKGYEVSSNYFEQHKKQLAHDFMQDTPIESKGLLDALKELAIAKVRKHVK